VPVLQGTLVLIARLRLDVHKVQMTRNVKMEEPSQVAWEIVVANV